MKILVTGTAGFIGFHTFLTLRAAGHDVLGVDNLNSCDDVRLKLARLRMSGFDIDGILLDQVIESAQDSRFAKIDIADHDEFQKLFADEKFDAMRHPAVQPSARLKWYREFYGC